MDKNTNARSLFNLRYSIDDVLRYFGYEPTSDPIFNVAGVNHTNYCHKDLNKHKVRIAIDSNNEIEVHGVWGATPLKDAFQCYACLYSKGDDKEEVALLWHKQKMHTTTEKERKKLETAEEFKANKNKLIASNNSKNVLEKRDEELSFTPVEKLTDYIQTDNNLFKNLISEVCELSGQSEDSVFLLGLGIFSSITSKAYCICDSKGETIPINLFVFVEQSSSNAKNYAVSYFQQPIFDFLEKLNKKKLAFDYKKDNYENSVNQENSTIDTTENLQKQIDRIIQSYIPITSITLPAIEKRLARMSGFCSIVSSENNLIDLLSNKNNDLLSSMFDGRFTNIVSNTKSLYIGKPIGSIVYFSFGNTIKEFLDFNNITEFQSKFLLLVDKISIGERKHTIKKKDRKLYSQYNKICNDLLNYSKNDLSYDSLIKIDIDEEGWKKIIDFKNKTEITLSIYSGETYPEIVISLFDNAETQIMKIAANLYLISDSYQIETGEDDNLLREKHVIPISFIECAITIFEKSMWLFLGSCTSKDLIGKKSECESILSIFINQPTSYTRNERQIIQSRLKVEPFKSLISYNKSDYIRDVLKMMVNENLLTFVEPDLYQIK
jgi:hypothetical protein